MKREKDIMKEEKKTGERQKRRRQLFPVLAALCLAAAAAAVFLWMGGNGRKGEEPVTLRFLLFGAEEPRGMDAVLEEFEKRTGDTLGLRIEIDWIEDATEYKKLSDVRLSSMVNYDLVFDAAWIHLDSMQEKGIYADLSPYLKNPDYPGLYGAFSEKILENNLVGGEQCALPVCRTYGSGIPCIYYRKDLAGKYGMDSVENEEELKAYLEALLAHEPEMIPLVLRGDRGFYNFQPNPRPLKEEQASRLVYPVQIGKVRVVAQLDESGTRVEAVGIMGDQEGFGDFMEGLQYDFLIPSLEGYREWNRYCEEDVLNRQDQEEVFWSGAGGAYIGTLDDYEEVERILTSRVEGAELGAYIINEGIREEREGAVASNYRANNYVCIPASSRHVEETVRFLDWLFTSRENHDLFEYGVEGIHWRAEGEERYEQIPDEEGEYYLFPGYTLTWNSHYVRFPAQMPPEILEYKEYELRESSFFEQRLKDFSFDDTAVKNSMQKVVPILKEAWYPLSNGVLENPVQTMQEAVEEAKRYGLYDILEEVKRQLQEYLDNQGN